jgi:MoxR-vWA-beta-propeller ternary system protein
MNINDVSSIPVTWQSRDHPLSAVAVTARGKAALALARRLLDLDVESLACLRGVAGEGFIMVIGEEESLPWVDGVIYLGRDPRAPSLLVPTTLEPSVPPALLERALAGRFPNMSPLVVFADAPLVVPLGSARPVAAASVSEWLKSQSET